MDLFKLIMNFKLSKLASSGAGITNDGVGGSWGRGAGALSWGGQSIHYLGFWEAVTNDSICLAFLFPKQANEALDQSPKHQTPLGCRLPYTERVSKCKRNQKEVSPCKGWRGGPRPVGQEEDQSAPFC